MAITYKLMNDPITGGSATSVKKTDDDGNISFIPFDTGNCDLPDINDSFKRCIFK